MWIITSTFFLSISLLVIAVAAIETKLDLECKKSTRRICTNNIVSINAKNSTLKLTSDSNSYKTLILINTNVKFLPVNLTAIFPALEDLQVGNSSLQEIERTDFLGLKGLLTLNLHDNLLKFLPTDVFEVLISLQKLILDGNQIAVLDSDIFSRNEQLVEISLSRNQLVSFYEETFVNLVNLKVLHVSFNQIEDIRAGTFAKCEKLKDLFIRNNKLKHIPEGLFDNFTFFSSRFKNNFCLDGNDGSKEIRDRDSLLAKIKKDCRPPNQKYIEQLLSQVEALKGENEKLKSDFANTEKKLKQKNDALKECTDDLSQKDDEMKEIREKADNATASHENCKYDLRSEKEKLSLQISDLNSNISSLKSVEQSFKVSQAEIKKLNEDFESARSLKYHSDKLWLNCMSEKNSSELKLHNMSEKVEDMRKEKVNLEAEKEKLKKDLDSKKDLEQRLRQSQIYTDLIFNAYEAANDTILDMCNRGCVSEFKDTCKSVKKYSGSERSSRVPTIETPKAQDSIDISCDFRNFDYKTGQKVTATFFSCFLENFTQGSSKISSTLDQPDGEEVEGVLIASTSLSEFPTVFIEKSWNLKFLDISESEFKNFSEDICEYSSDFKIIQILTSKIGNSIKLDSCTSITDLKIEESGISAISTDVAVPTLTNLNIKKNQIEKIDEKFFKNLKNLEVVNLSGNKITFIKGSIFDGNKALKIVNLSENPLAVVDGKLFQNNPQLKNAYAMNCKCVDDKAFTNPKAKLLGVKMADKCRK